MFVTPNLSRGFLMLEGMLIVSAFSLFLAMTIMGVQVTQNVLFKNLRTLSALYTLKNSAALLSTYDVPDGFTPFAQHPQGTVYAYVLPNGITIMALRSPTP